MKKLFLLYLVFNTVNIGIAQIPIEMENIYEFAVYEPDKKLKEAKVNTVSISERWIKWDVKTSSIEKYNESGYLVFKKNIDSNLIGGIENISIQRTDNEHIVTRKISRLNYDKITLKHTSFFWGKYFYFVNKALINTLVDSITVTSRLTWAEDSSIHYHTSLNSTIIDSGIAITSYTEIDPGSTHSCSSYIRKITSTSCDSIVVCPANGDSCNQVKETYICHSGKIARKIVQSKRNCELLSSDTVLFYYDSIGRLRKEEIFSLRGFLEMRKEYMYGDERQYKYWIEKYLRKGELESKTLYDQDENIHEREAVGWQGQVFIRREIYKYNEKGLLSNVEYFDDGVLSYKKTIHYIYFN